MADVDETAEEKDDTHVDNAHIFHAEVNSTNKVISPRQVDFAADSGSSDIIINDASLFTDCKEDDSEVKVGDGFSLKAEKVGTVNVIFKVNGACPVHLRYCDVSPLLFLVPVFRLSSLPRIV